MNFALIAFKLAPLVMQLVQMAEAAIPQSGAGQSKAALVLSHLGDYIKQVPALAQHAEQIKAAVQPHIGTAVALLNMFGWGKLATTVQSVSDVAGKAVDTLSAVSAAASLETAVSSSSSTTPAPAQVEAPARSHWDDKPAASVGG